MSKVAKQHLLMSFRTAAAQFAKSLQSSFASRQPAQPEDQLKGPVQTLLRKVRTRVLTKTEAHVDGLGGRPDIGSRCKTRCAATLS